MKKISLGSDHAGWELKQVIKEYLHSKTGLDRLEINDWGCYSEERCDYPDFAHKVAEDVENKKCDFGILICGSGNGINMTANKWSGGSFSSLLEIRNFTHGSFTQRRKHSHITWKIY